MKLSEMQKQMKRSYGPYKEKTEKEKQKEVFIEKYNSGKNKKVTSGEDKPYINPGQIGYNGTDLETTLTDEQREFLSARRANNSYTGFDENKKAELQHREDNARDYAHIRNFSTYGADEYAASGLAEDEKAVADFFSGITNEDGTINTRKYTSVEEFGKMLPALGRLKGYAKVKGNGDAEKQYGELYDVIADPEKGLKGYYSYFNNADEYEYFTATDENGSYLWTADNLLEEYTGQTNTQKKNAAFTVYAQRADDEKLKEDKASLENQYRTLEYRNSAMQNGYNPSRENSADIGARMDAINGLIVLIDTELGKRRENERLGKVEADLNAIAEQYKGLPNFDEASKPRELPLPEEAKQTIYYNINYRKDEMMGGTPLWYISDDELKIYNTKYHTEGSASADKYIEDLMPLLNKRMAAEQRESFEEYSKKHPYIATGISVPANLLGGVIGTVSTIDQKLYGKEIDPYSQGYMLQNMTNTVRDTAKKELAGDSAFGGFAYDTVTGLADMAVTMAVSAGMGSALGGGASVIHSALLGSQVFTSTTVDCKMRGLSDAQAVTIATLGAVAEIVTEKMGYDRIMGSKNAHNIFVSAVKNAIPEGLEEGTSAVFNKAIDRIVAGGQSEWNRKLTEYMKQGYSASEAAGMVFADELKEVGYESAVGAVIGGVMGGGATAMNAPYVRQQGKKISRGAVPLLIEKALQAPEASSAGLAKSLQKTLEKGKNLSDSQKGSLVVNMLQEGIVTAEDVHKMNVMAFYEDAGKRNPEGGIRAILERADPTEMGVEVEEAVEAITKGIKEGRKAQAENRADSTETTAGDVLSGETTTDTGAVETSVKQPVKTERMKISQPAEDYTAEVSRRTEEAEKENINRISQIYREVRTGKISSAGRQGMVAYAENKELVERALENTGTSGDMVQREANTVFAVAYTAGLNGDTFSAEELIKSAGVNSVVLAEPGVVNSLKLYHMAGISDISKQRNVKYWGEKSGLQKDDTYRKALRKFKLSYDVAGKLDAIGKVMGHKVILVENLKDSTGEKANAVVSDSNGTIKINLSADNLILNGAIHEIVHSLRTTDPESYNKLAHIVLEVYDEDSPQWKHNKELYQKKVEGKSKAYASDYVSEETVCKALGAIMHDSEMLNEFVQKDQNLAKRILKGLHDLIVKVNAWASGDAKISAEQKKAFSELEKDLYEIETVLFKALQKRKTAHGGAENRVEGKAEERFSIVENIIDNDGNAYDKAVLLDTDFFDGLSPMNWGKQLEKALKKRIEKSTAIMPVIDEKGNYQMLEFAGLKERASKNGGESHPVLGKLVRSKDNISKLAVIHIDEVVDISEESNPYYTRQSEHGWLDQYGWLHRKTFVINKLNGKIYELTFDIAKTRDGRLVLYATNGKIKEVGQTQIGSVAKKAKGTRSHSDYDDDYTTKSTESQGKNDERFDLADTEYLELAKDPVKNEARLREMVEEAAKRAGYTTPKLFHGTAEKFTVFLKTKFGNNTGAPSSKKAIFFTNSRNVAEGYAMDARPERINELYRRAEKLENQAFYNGKYAEAERAWEEYEEAELLYKDGGRVMEAYLKVENPLIYDFKGEDFREKSFNDLINQALRDGKDGVIFKNVYDGSNKTHDDLCDVYAVFDSNQVKSADPVTYDDEGNIIPISERFDTEKEDIRWDLADGEESKITKTMSEHKRAEILSKIVVEPIDINMELDSVDIKARDEKIREVLNSDDFEKDAREFAREYGAFKKYYNKDIAIEFDYGTKGFGESLFQQKGDKTDFLKAMSKLDEIVSAAKLIKVQDDRYYKILYPEKIIDNVYFMMSAYMDGDEIVPVKIEVKEYINNPNSMYMVITVDRINAKKIETGNGPQVNAKNIESVKTNLPSLSGYSISQIIPFVKSESLVKYFPDVMLNKEQQLLKQLAIKEESERTRIKEKREWEKKDRQYEKAVNEGDERKIKSLLKFAQAMKDYKRSLDENGEGIVYNEEYKSKKLDGVTYDDNGNLIPLSQRYNASLSDERFDLADDWNEKIKEFGTVPKGENPARNIDVPNKISRDRPISRFARTMMEAGVTPDDTISEFEKAILDGTMTHEVIADKAAETKAIEEIKYEGFKESLDAWDVLVRKGKVGKEELAFGMTLYNQCVTNKDTRNAMKIAADLVAEATSAGQTLQACRMLKKMTPDGQLYYLEKSVQKMKEEFSQKLGDRFEGLELDDKLMEEYLTAEEGESRDYIYDRICQHIADQIPSTFRDKWNSWRYLAMLGNPRTHIRNIIGNGIFTPVIRIKNFVAAVIEAGVVKSENRTKSIYKSKEAVAFAKEDFTKMVSVLQGQDAKYATTGEIESRRRIFKNRVLEFLRKKNFDFLEAEDMWFLKMHYVDALARAMTARKIDPEKASPKLLEELRAYAVEQAQIATYRDANAMAEALSKIQRKADTSKNKAAKIGGVVLEGVMPFKKTPMNIAKQGVNYSPISILTGTYKSLKKLKNSDAFSATEIIDDFAKGLTGTGIMMLGVFLASQGLITGAGDDEEKKRRFDKMTGEQTYAIKIGDSSYTIEWATPSCLPLFVGVELHRLASSDGISSRQVFEAISTLADPLLELSVFSGISDLIETVQYEEMNAPFAIASEIASSYLLQALPTVGGQLSRIIDPTKRNYYYDDKNSALPKVVQNFIGQAASKIPGASYLFSPSVDDWGREETYGGLFERVVENLVSPGYYSKTRYTEVDKELNRLYAQTGEAGVYPPKQQKYYNDGEETYHMTAEEYTEARKMKGEVSFDLIERLMRDEIVLANQETVYSDMTDEEKVKAIAKCYEMAGEQTKTTMFGKVKNKSNELIHNLTKDEYKSYSEDTEVIYNKTSKYLNIIFGLPDYSGNERLSYSLDHYARTYAEEIALRDASDGKFELSDWVAAAESYGEDAPGYILWTAFESEYGRQGAVEKLTDERIAYDLDIPEEVWEDVYIRTNQATAETYDNIDDADFDINKYLRALAYFRAASSDKDENGNSIANSKKKKVANFILSQGWTEEESEIIFDGLYKRDSVYDNY